MGDMSQLPEDIIHHILSYIKETKEAVRVSIFCKTWYNALLTCPTLSFRIISFSKDWSESVMNYFKFMERTLLRYERQKIHIEQLKLDLFVGNYCSAAHVNDWIRIAVQNGVKRVSLELSYYPLLLKKYILLSPLFEANSIRELSLFGSITLPMENQVDGKVMINNLQTLKLCRTHLIDDDMFHSLMAWCPIIENLHVEYCGDLEKIKVSNLYNLKNFTVVGLRENLEVEIEAPNLQYLYCNRLKSLKLYNTENLIHLALLGDITSTFLDNREHKFAQLVKLVLLDLKGRRRIDISSHSLKHIVLDAMNLTEVRIDAPNLVTLELHHIYVFPDLFLINTTILKIYAFRCLLNTNQQLIVKGYQSKIFLEMDRTVDVDNIQFFLKMTDIRNRESQHLTRMFTYFNYTTLTGRNLTIQGDNLWCQELKEVMKHEFYNRTKHQNRQQSDLKSLAEATDYLEKICFTLTWKAALAYEKFYLIL